MDGEGHFSVRESFIFRLEVGLGLHFYLLWWVAEERVQKNSCSRGYAPHWGKPWCGYENFNIKSFALILCFNCLRFLKHLCSNNQNKRHNTEAAMPHFTQGKYSSLYRVMYFSKIFLSNCLLKSYMTYISYNL